MEALEGAGNSGKNFRCQNILKIPALPAAYGPSIQIIFFSFNFLEFSDNSNKNVSKMRFLTLRNLNPKDETILKFQHFNHLKNEMKILCLKIEILENEMRFFSIH